MIGTFIVLLRALKALQVLHCLVKSQRKSLLFVFCGNSHRMAWDGYHRTTISWTDEALLKRCREAAEADHRSLSNWVMHAVIEYLDRHGTVYPAPRVGAGAFRDVGDATLEAEAAIEAAAFGRKEGASPGRGASAPIPAGPGAARTVPPDPKHKGQAFTLGDFLLAAHGRPKVKS